MSKSLSDTQADKLVKSLQQNGYWAQVVWTHHGGYAVHVTGMDTKRPERGED